MIIFPADAQSYALYAWHICLKKIISFQSPKTLILFIYLRISTQSNLGLKKWDFRYMAIGFPEHIYLAMYTKVTYL